MQATNHNQSKLSFTQKFLYDTEILRQLMKVKNINTKMTPHGGAIPILKAIKDHKIHKIIRSSLGSRKKRSIYEYDDIFIAWMLTAFCGGNRIAHITKLQSKLNIIPNLKLPSHDTLGRAMKELATDSNEVRNISRERIAKIRYTQYNDNIAMNRMLIKATKGIGALKENIPYTLDIDATFLSTHCRGADMQNKKQGKHGFAPLVALIGDLPVFVSLRKGNAGASFRLKEGLETCLDLLAESNIKVARVVSDGAGYTKAITEMLEARGIKFVIRFPLLSSMEAFKEKLQKQKWRKTEIRTSNDIWNCQIADVDYKMHSPPPKENLNIPLRVVAIRFPSNNTLNLLEDADMRSQRRRKRNTMELLKENSKLKQHGKKYTEMHLKKIGGFTYKFYVTNDFQKTSEEIVYEYNKRGDAERKFSYMKQEFGWRLPPFMWMEENNVFLIVAALANNVFVGIRSLFNEKISQISLKARLREFRFIFIDVVCEIRNNSYRFHCTDIEFAKIL